MKNRQMPGLLKCLLVMVALPLATVEASTQGKQAQNAAVQHSAFCQGKTKVVGLTFLKSHDPDPKNLISFLVKNWFEMDRIAVEQGLLTSYDLLSTGGEEESDWDVAVVVGYPSIGGYADIAEGFGKIRAAHQVVPVEGQTQLSDFGKIIGGSELKLLCG